MFPTPRRNFPCIDSLGGPPQTLVFAFFRFFHHTFFFKTLPTPITPFPTPPRPPRGLYNTPGHPPNPQPGAPGGTWGHPGALSENLQKIKKPENKKTSWYSPPADRPWGGPPGAPRTPRFEFSKPKNPQSTELGRYWRIDPQIPPKCRQSVLKVLAK